MSSLLYLNLFLNLTYVGRKIPKFSYKLARFYVLLRSLSVAINNTVLSLAFQTFCLADTFGKIRYVA